MGVSYGYRPRVGAKDAIRELTKGLQFGRYSNIVEADIKALFAMQMTLYVPLSKNKMHDPLNYYDHRWILVPVKSLRPVSSQVILPTKVAGLALSMPAYFSSLSLKTSGGRALFVLDSWTASYPRMIRVTYTYNQPYYDEGGDLPINGYKTVFRPAGNLEDPLGSIIYFKEVAYAIRINCKSFQWSCFTGGKWGALKSIALPDEIWRPCQPSVVNLGDRLLVTFASQPQSGDPYERYLRNI